MTTYTDPAGREITVCDGCGIGQHDGKPANLAKLKPVDQSEKVRAYLLGLGAPESSLKGCSLTFRDTCPACIERKETGAKP
jgi:hypothetical protein